MRTPTLDEVFPLPKPAKMCAKCKKGYELMDPGRLGDEVIELMVGTRARTQPEFVSSTDDGGDHEGPRLGERNRVYNKTTKNELQSSANRSNAAEDRANAHMNLCVAICRDVKDQAQCVELGKPRLDRNGLSAGCLRQRGMSTTRNVAFLHVLLRRR